ncbi:hypothetical protein GCM10010182_10860 [Actinomadura cremea]|nr:hypothetical protein GCM10010182_10860 [Actinomadura cremea]
MEPMTREELAALPTTTTIETAARALGLGRTRAYQLARENRFPAKSSASAPATASSRPISAAC